MQCFDQLDKISKMERIQFLCNDCGKDFVVDVKLGLHMYAMHTEKPFECAQCGERGSGVAKFKNHMRKHKSQNNVSKCDSRKPTITITSKECTKPSLAFGCAYLEHAKKIKNLL